MYYAGIDLHRNNLVVSLEDQFGAVSRPRTFLCAAPELIREFFAKRRPFRAVIEATCNYRWLYDLRAPLGEVVLAHPTGDGGGDFARRDAAPDCPFSAGDRAAG